MRSTLAALLLLLALAAPGCGRGKARDRFATPPARALAPLEVEHVYSALETGSEDLEPALADLVARGDYRFVAVLIEALRASQTGLLDGRHYNAKVVALERLSGQRLGADWFAWVRWYQGTSLRPPPDFEAFRARLLAKVDPELAAFFASGAVPGTRSEEILWSGAAMDRSGGGLVAHEPAEKAGLDPGEPVVGVALGGEARAYPLRWLDWHEVANDRLGGRPISVVWCGFCASAMAFGAPAGAPAPSRTFGASGFVQRSVRLMYDHETKTLWNELTGSAALGPGALEGARLEPLPAVLTTWGTWRDRNPATTALVLSASERASDAPAPYGFYHANDEVVFPVAVPRDELPPKAQVYGLEGGLRAKAWPLDALLAEQVRSDEVGGRRVVLLASRGRIEVEGTSPRGAAVHFSPGAEVRAYAAGDRSFSPGADPDELRDDQGRSWRATDTELLGPDGARAPRIPGTVAYWFAWQAFHPDTELGARPR